MIDHAKAALLRGNPKRMTFAEAAAAQKRRKLTAQFLFFALGVIVGCAIIAIIPGAR